MHGRLDDLAEIHAAKAAYRRRQQQLEAAIKQLWPATVQDGKPGCEFWYYLTATANSTWGPEPHAAGAQRRVEALSGVLCCNGFDCGQRLVCSLLCTSQTGDTVISYTFSPFTFLWPSHSYHFNRLFISFSFSFPPILFPVWINTFDLVILTYPHTTELNTLGVFSDVLCSDAYAMSFSFSSCSLIGFASLRSLSIYI